MRTCVVHIGMHKTGSTAIQNAIWTAARGTSVRYVNLGGPNHSIPLVTAFLPEPWRHRAHRQSGASPEQIGAERERVRRRLDEEFSLDFKTFVVSAESLCAFGKPSAAEFATWLLERVDKVRVVGYVRAVKSCMESTLQQRVKGGAVALDLQALYPSYRRCLAKFDELFGRENVLLRKYAPERFENGCVVQDFCTQTGIDVGPLRKTRANVSLSRNALGLLHNYRSAGHMVGVGGDGRSTNAALIQLLEQLKGERVRLSPELVAQIVEAQRHDLEWVENRIGDSVRDGIDEAARPDDIRTEADLLHVSEAAEAWLAGQLGGEIDDGPGRISRAMANLVRRIAQQVGDATPAPTPAGSLEVAG